MKTKRRQVGAMMRKIVVCVTAEPGLSMFQLAERIEALWPRPGFVPSDPVQQDRRVANYRAIDRAISYGLIMVDDRRKWRTPATRREMWRLYPLGHDIGPF